MDEKNINENTEETVEEMDTAKTQEEGTSEEQTAEEQTAEEQTSDEETQGNSENTDMENEKENPDSQDKSDSNSDGKKGFFKKEKKKDKKDLMIEELTDKYKRTFAEFDNFRKRSEKEKSAMYEIGAKDVIEKILPVVDNFERGFNSVSDENKDDPFVAGMDKIYQQLMKTLEDMGVKEIEAEGKEFDPNLHNAGMHIEDEELGENIIAEVLQKGYTYRESVVRHSMVKVAN